MTIFVPAAGAPIAALSPTPGLAKSMYCLAAGIALPNTLALNDTAQFFYMPKGAVIQSASLRASTPLDTNGAPTLTLDVGDATTAARIFSQSLAGSAASGSDQVPVFSCLGFQFTADTLIFATVHAAGATKAAGTLRLRIDFTIEGLAS